MLIASKIAINYTRLTQPSAHTNSSLKAYLFELPLHVLLAEEVSLEPGAQLGVPLRLSDRHVAKELRHGRADPLSKGQYLDDVC